MPEFKRPKASNSSIYKRQSERKQEDHVNAISLEHISSYVHLVTP